MNFQRVSWTGLVVQVGLRNKINLSKAQYSPYKLAAMNIATEAVAVGVLVALSDAQVFGGAFSEWHTRKLIWRAL